MSDSLSMLIGCPKFNDGVVKVASPASRQATDSESKIFLSWLAAVAGSASIDFLIHSCSPWSMLCKIKFRGGQGRTGDNLLMVGPCCFESLSEIAEK